MAPAQRAALEPLTRTLLDAAHADADARRAQAEEQGGRVEGEAAEQAAAILEEARRRGVTDGEERVAVQRSSARREARTVLLRAQQAAYDRVRDAAVAAVAEVLSHPAERGRLEALVVDALGPDARLEEAPRGGLLGVAPDGRRVDASVTRLVDLAMAQLDVEGLWAP